MAGKVGSSSFGVFLADGYDLLASKVKNVTYKIEAMLERTDGLSDSWEASSPTGIKKVTLTQDGAFFDDTTSSMHDAWKVSTATSRVVCVAYAGNTIGAPFLGMSGVYGMAYDVLGQLAQLTKANVAYTVSGQVDRGTIIQHWTAKTVDWNTKTLSTVVDYTADPSQQVIPITSATKANPCVVTTTVPHGLTNGQKVLIAGNTLSGPAINSDLVATVITTTTFSVAVNTSGSSGAGTGGTVVRSDSPNGAVGYQQVSASSGFTNFVGKLRDSADDITYADLITFADNVTAPYAERATVAGTVDRYMSFDGNVTGSGSITVFCGLSRS